MDMSSTNTPSDGSVKRYLRRRKYKRLDDTGKDKKAVRLGGERKQSWGIKATRKLKLRFRLDSPLKLLAKIRDGYITMMLKLAENIGVGYNVFGAKRNREARNFDEVVSKAGEFETKLIYEIYTSLKATRDLRSQ